MGRKRRTFKDKLKAKVTVEAIKGIKTLNELTAPLYEEIGRLKIIPHLSNR